MRNGRFPLRPGRPGAGKKKKNEKKLENASRCQTTPTSKQQRQPNCILKQGSTCARVLSPLTPRSSAVVVAQLERAPSIKLEVVAFVFKGPKRGLSARHWEHTQTREGERESERDDGKRRTGRSRPIARREQFSERRRAAQNSSGSPSFSSGGAKPSCGEKGGGGWDWTFFFRCLFPSWSSPGDLEARSLRSAS